MYAQQVETIIDFLKFGEHFAGRLRYDRTINRDIKLEFFLRSLWKAMFINAEKELTWRLFAEMIHAAVMFIPPPDFDESWQSYTKWPDFDEATDGFELAKAMILFQIADLQRIEDLRRSDDPVVVKQINDYDCREWINGPAVGSFLHAGFRYISDAQGLGKVMRRPSKYPNPPQVECDWFFIPVFLRAAQKYE